MGLSVICDAEFDSLTPTRLWCVVCKELETGEVHVFRYDEDKDWKNLKNFLQSTKYIIGHNFLVFDTTNINKLTSSPSLVHQSNVIDTLVLSRLIYAAKPGGHSIENIGKGYGLKKKPIIEYDRPELIDEYVERCISDVEINYAFYKKELERFVNDPDWQDAIKLEHDLALICEDMHKNGFGFNKERAEFILDEISNRLNTLTTEIQESVGLIEEIDKTVTLRRKKDGTPNAYTERLLSDYPDIDRLFVDGDEYTIRYHRPFNPGSTKDRIRLLNESGWRPTEKTKTHLEAERAYSRRRKSLTDSEKERWERLKETGWKTSEANLQTLPEEAPEGARKLAEWLTLEGRRADLEEWLGAYNERTGSIHSNIIHIGGWTQRCAHRNPNCANIFSQFHGKVRTPVDAVKDKYDGMLRGLWEARPNRFLIGCDAEGIQLRILAHLMGDEEYIQAVANGKKEDETDVHNVNKRALGLIHIVRDDAKTFIYAWLLGAGTAKVSSILRCSNSQAKNATTSFIQRYPGLYELKTKRIPMEANRGYFDGLDGRKVMCDSEHLMLAGHLQNGEKIIMARSNVLWRERLRDLGVDYRQVNFVHDEWQTEAFTEEEAHIIGEVQSWSIKQAGEDLNLLCPLAGEYKIGKNWLETH